MKVPKSKYNLQCLNLKLIAENILRYFSCKSAFDDKLKVSSPAGVDNYLIYMHCFETNTCAFLDTMWNFTDVRCDMRVNKWRHFRSAMQLVNFIILNDFFFCNIFYKNMMNSFHFYLFYTW